MSSIVPDWKVHVGRRVRLKQRLTPAGSKDNIDQLLGYAEVLEFDSNSGGEHGAVTVQFENTGRVGKFTGDFFTLAK